MIIFVLLLWISNARAEVASGLMTSVRPPVKSEVLMPACIEDETTIQNLKETMRVNKSNSQKYDKYKSIFQNSSDKEILARLIYAETKAAHCETHNPQVMSLITQVILNRVKKRNGDIKSVIYQRDQFASSMNVYDGSQYRDFLCPKDSMLWRSVENQIHIQSKKDSMNVSSNTYNYFFYKHNPKWTKAPWDYEEDRPESYPSEVFECIKTFKVPNWK